MIDYRQLFSFLDDEPTLEPALEMTPEELDLVGGGIYLVNDI